MDEHRERATLYLERLDGGDSAAAEQLLPIVYDNLRRLAEKVLGPGSDRTLQPTALVHEAYLKLIDDPARKWDGRRHFVRVAVRAMRQVMLDHAKGRAREKRGGGWRKVTLSDVAAHAESADIDLLDLDAALKELEAMNARLCRVAELRLLGGLDMPAIAALLDLGVSTAEGDWTMAKAFLGRALA